MPKTKKTKKTATAVVAVTATPKVKSFRQSSRFIDPSKNTLTVSVRQVAEESYRVSVSHKMVATGKRLSGMVTSHSTQQSAVAKMHSIGGMATKAGWVVSVKQRREAFTELPAAV